MVVAIGIGALLTSPVFWVLAVLGGAAWLNHLNNKMSSKPPPGEIVVTPEMLKAGVDALEEYYEHFPKSSVVTIVYKTMVEAKK